MPACGFLQRGGAKPQFGEGAERTQGLELEDPRTATWLGVGQRRQRRFRQSLESPRIENEALSARHWGARSERHGIRRHEWCRIRLGVVLELRSGKYQCTGARAPVGNDGPRFCDAVFRRDAGHAERALAIDRQQGVDCSRARPRRRSQPGDPEAVELDAEHLARIQHKDHRFAALRLERRGSQSPKLCQRHRSLDFARNRAKQRQLTQQFPEPPRSLKIVAAGRCSTRPTPGCEAGAKSLGPGTRTAPAGAIDCSQGGADRRDKLRGSAAYRQPCKLRPAQLQRPLRLAQQQLRGDACPAFHVAACQVLAAQQATCSLPVHRFDCGSQRDERRIHDRLRSERVATGKIEHALDTLAARKFHRRLQARRESSFQRASIQVQVRDDQRMQPVGRRRDAIREPGKHFNSFRRRIACPVPEAAARCGTGLQAFDRVPRGSERREQSRLDRGQAAKSGEQDGWALTGQRRTLDQEPRKVATIPGCQLVQPRFHATRPGEKSMLVTRQRPTRDRGKVAAVRAELQPARPCAGAQVRRVEQARRVALHLARPQPLQCDRWQKGRQFRPLIGGPLPQLQEPGIHRQHLGCRPSLAPGCHLRPIVQPPQDARLTQVRGQHQAAGLQVGDATGVRIQAATAPRAVQRA